MRLERTLTIFLAFALSLTCVLACESPWHSLGNNKCAYFSDAKVPRMDAYHWCQFLGGDLMMILSSSQNNMATGMMNMVNTDKYWIFPTNMGSSEFLNGLGIPVTYSNFADGTTFDSDDNCVYIDENGYWHPEECTNNLHFICVRNE